MKVRWYWPPIVAFLTLMVTNVQRLACVSSPDAPSSHERSGARRTALPPQGTVDEREGLPGHDIVSGPGVVQPLGEEMWLGAALPGRIARIAVAEGAHVPAGDVLVELDTGVERATLAAATAEVEASEARLRRALGGARRQDLEAAEAEAATAHARAELSRGVAERLAKVAASGGATEDELERAQGQAQADAAQARAADARRAGVLAGTRREDVELARAELAAAQARRDQATAMIERLTVRAPTAVEVLDVRARIGEYYAPGGEPLIVVGDTSKLVVRMDVDERDVGRIRVGARATVTAVGAGRELSGQIVSVGHRMGGKRVRTDEPGERNDTRVLEAMILLDEGHDLIVGQRVSCTASEAK